MAMKFDEFKLKASGGSGPKFGSASKQNPIELFVAKQMYDQDIEKKKANEAIQGGGVPTEVRANGTTFSMPGARTATADAQNQLTRIKQLKIVAKELQDLGRTLPTDLMSAAKGMAGAKFAYGRFGTAEHKTYLDSLPAASAGIYRAITGDNRLSDADAAARAKPLIWHPMEPGDVREGKNAFLTFMLDEAERNVSPGEPTSDLESLMKWQTFVNSSKEKFQAQVQSGAPLTQSQPGPADQNNANIEQQRMEARKKIESGKYDAKKVADIFRSMTGQEL